jgi:hypothetical protein
VVRVQQEQREERALLLSTERKQRVAYSNLQRSKDAVLHAYLLSTSTGLSALQASL